MTHPAVTEYLEAEGLANKTPQGANHREILARVAGAHDLSVEELRRLVLDVDMQFLEAG